MTIESTQLFLPVSKTKGYIITVKGKILASLRLAPLTASRTVLRLHHDSYWEDQRLTNLTHANMTQDVIQSS